MNTELTVNDYLDNLELDRQDMINSLKSKGMEISDSATFTELVPKIDGLVDINGYFSDTISSGSSVSPGWKKTILKLRSPLKIEGTRADYMFYGCSNITTIPQLDTSNVTIMSSMFENCKSLTTIPQLDTSNVINMSYMFNYCYNLISVPQLNTSNVTIMIQMFSSCSSLTTIPQLDTSNVTDMDSMFSSCSNLTSIPQLNTSNVNSILHMFNYCSNLTTLGGLKDLGKAYSTTQSANYNYYKLDLSKSTKLTHDSLINVINNLYDIATKGCNTQQLVLGSTNLAKLTEEEIAIATNKGWTVS